MCVPTIHNMQHKLFVRTTLKEFFVGFLYLFDRPNHTPNLVVWNSKTYPKFGVWNPKKYSKFGVWNGSGKLGSGTLVCLGEAKNTPFFFIYNIPPKFGVFFGFPYPKFGVFFGLPYPKFGVFFGLPYTKLRVFFGSLLSCAFHYLILFHPAPKPFHSQTGRLLPAFRFPFLVS